MGRDQFINVKIFSENINDYVKDLLVHEHARAYMDGMIENKNRANGGKDDRGTYMELLDRNFNKINDKSIIMKYFYPFEVKSGVNKYKRNLEKIDKIKEILQKYKEDMKKEKMEMKIFIFDEVIENVLKLTRLFYQNESHAVLIGLGGSG